MSAGTVTMTGGPKSAFALARPPIAPSFAPSAVAGAMGDYRVLVTASREWVDPCRIWAWLDGQHAAAMDAGHRVVMVMHGDAAGGDQVAKLWGSLTHGAITHPFPADWGGPCRPECPPGHRKYRQGRSYCPRAGLRRNALMVSLRPHICGAFILDHSPGATHCARLAREAGIPTEVFHAGG